MSVLVTGGGSGIGLATARAFADHGARVVAADISVNADQDRAPLSVTNGTISFVHLDVRSNDGISQILARMDEAFGGLDIAFNNAGVMGGFGKTVAETDDDAWVRTIEIGLQGVFSCMRAELARMGAAGRGVIVNTSSVIGLRAGVNSAPYAAAKSGLLGLTRSAALQYAGKGVRINALCPGMVDTDFVRDMAASSPASGAAPPPPIPMRRLAQPDEIAQAVLWLCSGGASYVTGIALPVDGGWTAS